MDLKKVKIEAAERLKDIPRLLKDLSKMETNELFHEINVYRKELEMQNDELRELQYRLEEVRDQYTDLFDFAPISYLILDKKGTIKNLNLTACRLLRNGRSSIKGTSLVLYVSNKEDNLSKFYKHLELVYKTNTLQSCVILLKNKEGNEFFGQIDSISVENERGEIKTCRTMVKDMTTELKAKFDIQQAKEHEIKLTDLKSRFVSMASHEFRTPLTSVLSSVQLLSRYIGEKDNQDRQQKHVDRIKSSVYHLTDILNEFLTVDKLNQGKVEVNKNDFDLKQCAEEVIDSLEVVLKKGQIIIYAHHGEVNVNTDKLMIRNIFNNLISNAIKYSDENSEIIFETKVIDGFLSVFVKDFGIGIPEEDQAALFNPFYRAKNVSNIEGTGLGLNIVKNYLELLNGQISFESKLGEGTTFAVTVEL